MLEIHKMIVNDTRGGNKMKVFEEYLNGIDNLKHRERLEEIFDWIEKQYPNLEGKIAWNQPMFTDHGTYILGFSISKNHLAVAPETIGIDHFYDEILRSGYECTKQLIRIPWKSEVDFSLLDRMIAFNIMDKANCDTFWRK